MTATSDGEVTTAQACELLGVNRHRLYRLIHDGELPARRSGRHFLIRRTDIERLSDRVAPATEPPRKNQNRPRRSPPRLVVEPPVLVPLTPEDEQRAVDALVVLLVPHLRERHLQSETPPQRHDPAATTEADHPDEPA